MEALSASARAEAIFDRVSAVVRENSLAAAACDMGNSGSCCGASKEHHSTSIDEKAEADHELELPTLHPVDTLCLLSWNIDGLDKQFTTERALAVSRLIELRKPEVVFLQEIVPSTWDTLTEQLGTAYSFYRDEVSFHYYHVLLVRKASTVIVNGDFEILRFPKSQQGRHLLQLPVKFHNLEMLLLTSHLESMNHYASERKNQLKTVFSIMKEAQGQQQVSVFAGDLNLLDKEVHSLPDNIVDVWEACGTEYKDKCTWESTDPRFRLDRVYFSTPDENCVLSPTKFSLVGKSIVKGLGVHASDHLGMWVEFRICHPNQPPRMRVYSS